MNPTAAKLIAVVVIASAAVLENIKIAPPGLSASVGGMLAFLVGVQHPSSK